MSKSMIWAHRGASHQLAENTMPAFELAVRQQAQGIELDVQLSNDGRIMVIHDEKTDRTAREKGWVHQLSFSDLRKMNAAAFKPDLPACKIPELAEVLDLVRSSGIYLNIELKNGMIQMPGLESMLINLVNDFHLNEQVVFSSFNHYSIRSLHEQAGWARCGLLYQSGIYEPWLYAKRVGASALHPHWGNLQIPGLVEDAAKAGIDINVWTVNNPAKILQAASHGVNAIITDKPDLAIRELAKMNKQ